MERSFDKHLIGYIPQSVQKVMVRLSGRGHMGQRGVMEGSLALRNSAPV
jgi:hypothetical protein